LFLRDLYYRIAGVTITVPALRRRREDIPLLLDRFLEDDSSKRFAPEALSILFDHIWEGNVRELRDVVGQCRKSTRTIQAKDLPSHITESYEGLREYHDRMNVRFWLARTTPAPGADPAKERFKGAVLAGQEKQHREAVWKEILQETLVASNWNITKAAKALKKHRSTVHTDMKKFGISRPQKAGIRS
jgi:DNA-binding NtrC family response regulator